jgi:hypothetical protein
MLPEKTRVKIFTNISFRHNKSSIIKFLSRFFGMLIKDVFFVLNIRLRHDNLLLLERG